MRHFNSLTDFYTSREWARFREQLIMERMNERGETIDEYTGDVITKKYEIILHHKCELTEENVNDLRISLNPQNIMIVSHRSHNKIHERFGHDQGKKIYLVYGASMSGKTTFVREHAGRDDLIIDINNIWACVSNNDQRTKSERLKWNVFALRDSLLDQVRVRHGKWKNAWIVMGAPLLAERERFKNMYGCECIHIDTPYDECIRRLYNQTNGKNIDEWRKYIDEWFERFQPDAAE